MSLVIYKVVNRVAFISINRPEKRNALNAELVTELKSNIRKAGDDNSVKVIILKAEGEVFCAGADLEYLQQLQKNTYEENLVDSKNLMELFQLIYTLNKVVIAQIHGHAIAGGAGLVSVCDFSFSVPKANFGYTEVKIGFIPAIVMVFLIRKIGEAKSKELLLSGHLVNAEEAKNLGLINYVVNEERLDDEVLQFAQKLCSQNSSASMELTKKMIAEVQNKTLEEGLLYAAEMNAKARGTEDCKKGIASFLNKEKLSW